MVLGSDAVEYIRSNMGTPTPPAPPRRGAADDRQVPPAGGNTTGAQGPTDSSTAKTFPHLPPQDVFDRQFDAVLLEQTNFWLTGSIFFLSRFLHPLARLTTIPGAMEAPAIFVAAFLVPTLGLLTMTVERKFHLLCAVGGLDVLHWVLATIPMHYAAYWTLPDDMWAYPLNLLAIGHVITTVVFVLTYGRNIVAERYRPKSESKRKAKTRRSSKTRVHFAEDVDERQDRDYSYRTKGRKSRYQRSTDCTFPFDGDRRDRRASWEGELPRGKPAEDDDPVAITRGKIEAGKIIKELREELLGIGSIQKRKVRLRELQKQYHPDKNPPKEEEKVREVFHYVQKWWDDIDGIYEGEFRAHLEV